MFAITLSKRVLFRQFLASIYIYIYTLISLQQNGNKICQPVLMDALTLRCESQPVNLASSGYLNNSNIIFTIHDNLTTIEIHIITNIVFVFGYDTLKQSQLLDQ